MNSVSIQKDSGRTAGWRERLAEVGARIESGGAACDGAGTFVSSNLDLLHGLGFFALGVPRDLGGLGAPYAEVAEMLRAVARLDGSTALALSMHTHQVMVAEWKRRVQQAPTEALLRKVALDGLRIVSSGGSDWLPGSGQAEKVDGGYRIFARKVFSSGAPDGDVMNTCAIYTDPEQGPLVLHFSLPMKVQGVTIMDNWRTLGMRGTASQDVRIDGVFIPDSAVAATRPPGKWGPLFHLISLIAFPLIYAVYAGVADRAREIALAMARRRAGDQALAMAVGDLENAHAAMNLAVSALIEVGTEAAPSSETTNRVMILKGLAARHALEVGSKALEVAGGGGFFCEAGLERRFRDLQGARYHPLQERQQQLYAGRFALGMDLDG